MASTSSYRLRGSPSADTSVQWKYDVFLSFRGEDTRQKFTSHLYDRLDSRGIRTFRDDPDLERGTAISPELLVAIEQSRFAVVVLSSNYASSTWCLMELVKIVDVMKDKGRILPIFYEVDPSDVRHQKGSFEEAFAKHEVKFGDDLRKVQEWRDALTEVANFAGWSSNGYRYETELIKEIVQELWNRVSPTFASSESESLQDLVGIDSKLMEIEFLLDTKRDEVCFMGIWGMGGIGKTTLARQVHRKISHHFDVSIFLADVRQVSTTHGLVHQQEQLLCQILKEKRIQVHDVVDGVDKIKRCLSNKKVLLVLDDVDHSDQLQNLAGGKNWFRSGSIIIITTRDKRLLASHGIQIQYKSKGLNEYEALQLFSWKAFEKDYPEEGYSELSKSILEYSQGLPLALKILGSFLYKRDRGDWESTVANLKNVPIDQVLFRALRISYDGLDKMAQQVFLDVACFLKGNEYERIIDILDSSFRFDSRIMMSVLIEKSLLTIFDNCVDMHDLIQEMGREIVRLESENEPGKRSQLWLRNDILQVLKENTGTQAIRSIAVSLPEVKELAWNPSAFSSMSKLKFLKMQNLILCPGPKYLPDDIRVLEWNLYPAESLPLNFQPEDIIELTLHNSKIHHLWHGVKSFNKLTIIDLSFSNNLTETPDFTGIENLERLILEGCTSLVYIHPSITSLRRLKILNFKDCRSITSFPGELEVDSLELLYLSGCTNILPQPVRRIQKLSKFFSRIGKQKVSYNSVRPHHLSLVLASLKHFCFLKVLYLNNCKLGEDAIPDDFGCLSSLEYLDLSANDFISLPASMSHLSKLKCLNLTDCKRLELFPCLPSVSGACLVTAENCVSLKRFPDLPDLKKSWELSLNFINCRSSTVVTDTVGVKSISHIIIYSILLRLLQEPPPFFESFSTVIPGNVIPRWFRHQRKWDTMPWGSNHIEYNGLDTVTVTTPKLLECPCRYKWMGYALCVRFGPAKIPGVLGEDNDSEPHTNTISCSWKPGAFVPASFSFDLNQVVKSDHLWLFILPSRHFHGTVRFVFDTTCATQGNSYLKVKGCQVRALYKEEVKELQLRMKQNIRVPEMIICSSQLSRRCRDHPFAEVFSFVIFGKDIPEWFIIKAELVSSLNLDLPCSSCRSTWLGFVFCVLFEADENPGGLCDTIEPTHVTISCCRWALTKTSIDLEQVVHLSDQLCVFFVPADNQIVLNLPNEFRFETRSANSDDVVCLKVKRYGFRRLYEDDIKDPYRKGGQYFLQSVRIADSIEQLSSSIKCRVVSTPIFTGDGEGGSGLAAAAGGVSRFDFDVDRNLDLELDLALEVSMEEERARQEATAKKAAEDSSKQERGGEEASSSQDATMTELRASAITPEAENMSIDFMDEDNTMLQLALAMSMDDTASSHDLRDTVKRTHVFTGDGEAGNGFGEAAAAGGVSGFDFGLGPNLDIELALALRVSLEEERARQEAAAKTIAEDSSKQEKGGEEPSISQDATMTELHASAVTSDDENKCTD